MSTSRLNILSKMYLIPFLCILTSTSLSAASIPSCESDGDCPLDHYCYTPTHICAQCIPNYCSRFHRKDSVWKQCHQEPLDCGPCLAGYEEEILSDGSNRDSCILSHQPTTAQAMGYKNVVEGGSSVTYLSSLIGLPGIVLIIGFFVYSRVRRPIIVIPRVEETELKQLNNQCNNIPENESSNDSYSEATAPMLPGYSREDPCRPRQNVACEMNEPVTDSYEHSMQIKRRPSSCVLLQSAVFRRPNYEEVIDNVVAVQDHEGDDEEDVESHEAEEGPTNRDDCLTAPQVQYHDENTMPSSWTPGPAQSEDENTSVSTNPENAKRPSTEMGSSGESEDEQNPKRLCNSGNEEENESPSMSSFYPNLFRNFTAALSSIRNQNNTQNRNPNANSDSIDS